MAERSTVNREVAGSNPAGIVSISKLTATIIIYFNKIYNCLLNTKARWSNGMILALGARGSVFDSRVSPI